MSDRACYWWYHDDLLPGDPGPECAPTLGDADGPRSECCGCGATYRNWRRGEPAPDEPAPPPVPREIDCATCNDTGKALVGQQFNGRPVHEDCPDCGLGDPEYRAIPEDDVLHEIARKVAARIPLPPDEVRNVEEDALWLMGNPLFTLTATAALNAGRAAALAAAGRLLPAGAEIQWGFRCADDCQHPHPATEETARQNVAERGGSLVHRLVSPWLPVPPEGGGDDHAG